MSEEGLADLETLIREAASRKMTPAEVFEQRVSFVYGMLSHNSPLTKEDVRARLAEKYGAPFVTASPVQEGDR
jgi:hypothetical protein